jgi:hypothetical protein
MTEMENNSAHPVPNSPQELFAMQGKSKAEPEVDDCELFADCLDDLIEEFEPSPYQMVKAIERALEGLCNYHFNTIIEGGDEMTPQVLRIWKEDYKNLTKALNKVKIVHPD